ncbi:MAG: SUMF1/EgtB/PvdO family nonheme iron enzyme [Acidobacteria bacterium]|nr:SUMF1/EgtB/PvdO family nonheme iron enzyme [Acidobacteriota bacterium]
MNPEKFNVNAGARYVIRAFLLAAVLCTPVIAQEDLKQAGVCSRCHVVSVLEWQISAHVAAGANCQSCHGPSAAHVANERNEVSPDRIPRGAAADGLCSTCHTQGCPSTKQTTNCLACHNQHSLTKTQQIQTFEGDRSTHPIHEEVARLAEFRETTARAEELVQKQEWSAAKSVFEEALRFRPSDQKTIERIAFCKRRLKPDMPGFDIVGEEFDAVSGLPLEVTVAGTGIAMRLVPRGEFDIGAEDYTESQPVHTVAIDAFYLGRFEITQAEWEVLMGSNPSKHSGDGSLPVERVSWRDAQEFVAKLNRRTPAEGLRLPTEAEWEYAARAGRGLFKEFELARYAWYRENSGSANSNQDFRDVDSFATHQVGQKEPNGWGFHDMHGNVWEWTSSLFRPYFYDPADGRESTAAEGHRVLRGGGYADMADLLNPALRHPERPTRQYRWNGLRLARDVP